MSLSTMASDLRVFLQPAAVFPLLSTSPGRLGTPHIFRTMHTVDRNMAPWVEDPSSSHGSS